MTRHPTAEWRAHQLLQAFPWDTASHYLLRDRDGIYGEAFRETALGLGIEEVLCAPRSPWQNAYAERLIRVDTPEMSGSRDRLPRAGWFDWQHHSMLIDLCDEPLTEELD